MQLTEGGSGFEVTQSLSFASKGRHGAVILNKLPRQAGMQTTSPQHSGDRGQLWIKKKEAPSPKLNKIKQKG